MPDVRLLVLSDLHAHDARFAPALEPGAPPASLGKPSWLDYSDRLDIATDPVMALLSRIRAMGVRADVLVVPGDVCDKANGDALRQAWGELEQVRIEVGASALIATAGNHDVDSRYRANTYDPRESLLELVPGFPVVDQAAKDAYWANAVTQVVVGRVRFVIVNSCAHHGGAAGEIYHGRISPVGLTRLKAFVKAPIDADFHVLVCHHHPHPFPGQNGAPDDRMYYGESLLEILDESQDEWLVVHGHRHVARLIYAGGSTTSPVVLAAGSMSVRLSPPLSVLARNQAHIVTLSGDGADGLRGRVESWNYVPRVGWTTAGDDGGLPHYCGFGYRGSLRTLALEARERVMAYGGPTPWSDLVRDIPDLSYLTPADLGRFKSKALALGLSFDAKPDGSLEAALL